MLRDLDREVPFPVVDARVGDLDRVVERRQVARIEPDVDDRSDDLDDVTL
jgi:hypothetical protein